LSGSLAHELNQPLTSILSNAQAAQRFLAHEVPDLKEVREILTDIVDADRRAGEVIRRLRLLLTKGEVQAVALDVNEVIHDVLRLMRSDLINQGVHADMDMAAGLPNVRADRVQLQQVVLNLLVNACDAMSAVPAVERRLSIKTERKGGEVMVSVSDRGCGIPADRMDRIFEPFFTTKTAGMGLGLAVCRTIITAHGGRLWASNNDARGATVHFVLPVDQGAAA
jgi:C4-dicarboxylate-specific signal transduction histidine kinase